MGHNFKMVPYQKKKLLKGFHHYKSKLNLFSQEIEFDMVISYLIHDKKSYELNSNNSDSKTTL